MAAADRTRRKQRGQCARSPQLLRWSCILFWGAVWVWFGARTLRAANRVLACQQFGCACLHAACLGARQVVETGIDDKWGPVVAIEDESGRVWRVCGTADAKVKKGDTVSAGQTIGKVGSVSCECAEESHIHLEVMQDGRYLDPVKAMK